MTLNQIDGEHFSAIAAFVQPFHREDVTRLAGACLSCHMLILCSATSKPDAMKTCAVLFL